MHSFDVFLSHNSNDKPAVRDLKQKLEGKKLKVWLDEDELRPGIPWQRLLEDGIGDSGSVAVLVGKDGLGPWEDEEMRAALEIAVQDKRPVIPVLLPGAPAEPKLPSLLKSRTWVDFREGYDDSRLGKLVWGITGRRPGDKEDQEAARIFLCYARRDERKIEKYYHMLNGAGYKPWMRKFDIFPGQIRSGAIQDGIQECNVFLVFISTNSVDKHGEIEKEIKFALDRFDEIQQEDIYLIPARLEDIELPDRLREIHSVDLFERDGWNGLMRAIESRGFPGIDKPATPLRGRWTKIQFIRQSILDVITPTYILDNSYHFLDWNRAFDVIVAMPTGIRRGDHALDFIRRLANCQEVIERSKELFGSGSDPLVDMELLHFESQKYGLVLFQKIGTQLSDERGRILGWCVNLNVLLAEQLQLLWEDLRAGLEQDVNWTRYAISYDKLLEPFDDYWKLLKLVTDLVQGAKRCIDLGAGTGNVTSHLLREDPLREVWAVESNEAMLGYLRTKLAIPESSSSWGVNQPASLPGLISVDRLTIVKEDILRIDDLPAGYFDAAVLMNVLYTVDDPELCLRQAHRVLARGGVLVLSTPHCETDVDKLFQRMQEVLEQKNLFRDLELNFEVARRAHAKMIDLIHRDSKDDIRGYLKAAGFVTKEWHDRVYADAVVVVQAKKP
jgi:SAM-dependent methyltransferase